VCVCVCVCVKSPNTIYLAPQAANCSCNGAFCHRQIGRAAFQLRQPHAALVCRLMVSTPVIHVITWITTHLPTSKGWEAELTWLADLQLTLYPQSGHMSTADQGNQGKSASQRPTDRRPSDFAALRTKP